MLFLILEVIMNNNTFENQSTLLEIIENQRFISSLNNGKESPSNVSDFKTRDFHGKIGLFE